MLNYRVLRIELSAQSMPREFPLDQVESAVDYDCALIGEGKYLLPGGAAFRARPDSKVF